MTLALFAAAAVAAADLPLICPDRPGKGTGTCTVAAGHIQIETGLVDRTRDRSAGVRTDVAAIGSSLIKYGIGGRLDIEVGLSPLVVTRTRGAGAHERVSGFGDIVVRTKYRMTADDAAVAVALDPFAKVPTAKRRLGNGKVEAGLTVPVSVPIGETGLTLSSSPEIDWRANGDGDGHHPAMIQVASIGVAASRRMTVSVELWRQWDWDPAGTIRQASADASVAYAIRHDVQVDAGVNIGLNRQTPDTQIYGGIAKRF